MRDDDHHYHVERARAELDAAYRATGGAVAAAHLRLSSLHMRRARDLAARPLPPPAAAELDWLDRCAPLHEKCLA
ncbi:MAG: hypothetical protein JOZ90_14655 [Alphaproteobacteria bacterium]|nr:hypothetical protein [Alphaproteobacteria bacterium]MBV9372182.1 hypothetical protein [Alphaproteobacteria bacterium]MBV9902313.1 hypothetical protein [Alphaproteobacteria bacterium]